MNAHSTKSMDHTPQRSIAMLALVFIAVGLLGFALAVALGWTRDTTRPVRHWYPAGPDPEPWRTD
jgi:hypothetical protein